MKLIVLFSLVTGALLAAGGQILFKIGTTGMDGIYIFLNPKVILGVLFYAVGALCWIYAISRTNLITVYPFTALTAVIVYSTAIFLFGEHLRPLALVGIVCVMAGLFLVAFAEAQP